MATDRTDRQQRQIDLEKTVSRSREIVERARLQRQVRAEMAEAAQERAWLRDQVAEMIDDARSLQELADLGVSDELIRGLGLSSAVRHLRRGDA